MMVAALLMSAAVHAAPPLPVWSTDLQGTDGGLVPSGSPDQWEWGRVETGPGAGFDGPYGWATRLDQVHMNNADDRLTLPPISLADAERPVLALTHWHDFEPGDDDWGVIERCVEGTWEPAVPLRGPLEYTGQSGDWLTHYVDLTGIADLSEVRLRFQSDEAVARDGWVIGALAVVDGDPVPPIITLVQTPSDTQDHSGPHPVSAIVTDDVGVTSASVVWFTGASERREAILFQTEPGIYEGSLPGADPGTTYIWWIEASDAAGNVGIATGPSFRTFLPAPTGLRGPSGRWVDATVPLEWTPPESPWPIVDYTVSRNGTPVVQTPDPSADAPVSGPSDQFTVAARFETDDGEFVGDASPPLAIAAYPPTILRVSPAAAWPGDSVRIELQGRYLLLVQDDVSIDLGAGIEISEIEVVDADTVTLRADVWPVAPAGVRTVELRSGDHEAFAEGAFEVNSTESRPRIATSSPTRLIRGERTQLTLRTTVSLPADPRLDLGTGVVVESGSRIDDRTVRFTVAVATDAPLGGHIPELDIGTRLLTGPPIDIAAPQPAAKTLCGPSLAAGLLGAWWLVPLWGLARRQDPTPDGPPR